MATTALFGLMLLAGCGGGGGGGSAPPPPTPTLVIDASNSDTLAHSTAAGVLAMSPAQTLPLAATDRSQTLGFGFSVRPGWLGHIVAQLRDPLRARIQAADTSRRQPLAVTGPIDSDCAVSGKMSTTFDDRDNNGVLSVGDVLTIAFHACKISPDETLDGVLAVTETAMASDGSYSELWAMSDLTDATSRHATTTTGTAQFDATASVMRMTAVGPVKSSVSTHLPFNDTVTLFDGFVAELSIDGALSALTIDGLMASSKAGGTVAVSTRASAPLVQSVSDSYPRSGIVDVVGKTGTLVISAESTDTVQLQLDANDDGTPEARDVVAWDWLF